MKVCWSYSFMTSFLLNLLKSSSIICNKNLKMRINRLQKNSIIILQIKKENLFRIFHCQLTKEKILQKKKNQQIGS